MSYGKVKDTFWTDKKVRGLSDDAKMLALYLMTGPHRNLIGCARIPDGYIVADLGWSESRVADAISMLSESHFICRDDDGWTLVLNQLKHDPVKVPNHAVSAIALAEEVPIESVVYQPLVERLKPQIDGIEKAPRWHPRGIAIPEPLPEPSPLPEPEPSRGAEVAPFNFPVVVAEQFDWKGVYDGFKRHMGTKAGGYISKLRQCSGEKEMGAWLRMLDRGEIANPHEYFGAIISDRYRGRDKPTMPGNSKTLQVFEELERKLAK